MKIYQTLKVKYFNCEVGIFNHGCQEVKEEETEAEEAEEDEMKKKNAL